LSKLEIWLEDEPRGRRLFFWMVLPALGLFFYNLILTGIISLFILLDLDDDPVEFGIKIVSFKLPIILLGVAFIEELLFRLAPLSLALYGPENSKITDVLVMVVISSIIFGVLHGGYFNILFQGVDGLVFCLVFLKCGGWHHCYWKAIGASTVCHAFFNLLISYLAYFMHGV